MQVVILSSIVLPYSANTQAAMIGTAAIANVEAQRAKVKDFVARGCAEEARRSASARRAASA